MSARYSTSPTLRLPIAESRICALWQGAFQLLLFFAIALVASRGYPWLAAVLILPAVLAAPGLCRQPLAGAIIHWRRGRWVLQCGVISSDILLHPSSRVSPLGVYLCWTGDKWGKQGVWLFSDSAPPDQLRRLRVRLRLEG